MKDPRSYYLLFAALIRLSCLMLVPYLLILALAFFRRGTYGGIEYDFTWENLAFVFDSLCADFLIQSTSIAGMSACIAVVIGYAAAYTIAATPKHRQGMLLFFETLPSWSNYLFRTYAWIELLNHEGLIASALRALGIDVELPRLLYTEDELCDFLQSYERASGEFIEIAPDTVIFFPQHWRGICTVQETVKKVYMIR